MYDLRQFFPTLYLLTFLGFSGFALATQAAGLWLLSTALLALNGWLLHLGRFRPLPRLVANVLTLLATAYMLRMVWQAGQTPILAIGNFLVLLQLVKLYEQRGNRDYAQVLVLSLLLMVASAISTASLWFGLLLILYLLISLYCCLLFHLKVETEAARLASSAPAEKFNPATLRQEQRFLHRSMRRLTALVALVSIAMAVGVFLFFPRGSGAGMLGQMQQFRASQALTGFSDSVSFQQIARIGQNNQIVAHVYMWKNERPAGGTEPLLLRGSVLDIYDGADESGQGSWQWFRSATFDDVNYQLDDRETATFPVADHLPHIRQHILLQPTGTSVLFSIPGPISFTNLLPPRTLELRYSRRDQVLRTRQPLTGPLEYEVVSTGQLQPPAPRQQVQNNWRRMLRGMEGVNTRRAVSGIDPQIEQFARRPEVGGSDSKGPLVAQRGKNETPQELDRRIAANFEQYFRRNFSYTLDLTDARRLGEKDPMVSFLYDLKRGHCEYFAGAMTLMCQSLGMQARMVIGFKCDEFNQIGGYYIVRQSHAHAWVEVLTPEGWISFDPTSTRGAPSGLDKSSMLQQVKHLFDFLEQKWASGVVGYDNDNQENLLHNLDAKITNTATSASVKAKALGDWLGNGGGYLLSSSLIGLLIAIFILAALVAVGYFILERWRLRRRAVRIGLESLPESEQLRLARQLGFYDELTRLLARHHIHRAKHLTPREFSRGLDWLPSDVYESIGRLTELFYRIRYSDARLSSAQHRHVQTVINRLAQPLGGLASEHVLHVKE